MALYVKLKEEYVNTALLTSQAGPIIGGKAPLLFYDPYTGTTLTAEDRTSGDLSSFIGETLDDGVTPKLVNIGAAIQQGILEIDSSSTDAFPVVAMAQPLFASHCGGALTIIPGEGALSGKYYEIFMTDSGISGREYIPSGRIPMFNLYHNRNTLINRG